MFIEPTVRLEILILIRTVLRFQNNSNISFLPGPGVSRELAHNILTFTAQHDVR